MKEYGTLKEFGFNVGDTAYPKEPFLKPFYVTELDLENIYLQVLNPANYAHILITESKHTTVQADGGPASYYDYPPHWNTHNDYVEDKSKNQWLEHSWHLANVSKVLTRWGDKEGTSKTYDAKKGIYSFCRVLMALIGKEAMREYLQKLLDDPQFK